MPKNNSNARKNERRNKANDRNNEAAKYPCGHMHVEGNQHNCKVYTYNHH